MIYFIAFSTQLRERDTQNKIDLSEFPDLALYTMGRVEDNDCFGKNCFDVTDFYKDTSHKAWAIAYGNVPCTIKDIPIPNQPMYMGWSDPMGFGSGGYVVTPSWPSDGCLCADLIFGQAGEWVMLQGVFEIRLDCGGPLISASELADCPPDESDGEPPAERDSLRDRALLVCLLQELANVRAAQHLFR